MAQRFTLEEWRKVRHKTQEDMAKALDITSRTYQKWEQSPTFIRLGDLVEILKILDIEFTQVKMNLGDKKGDQEEEIGFETEND